jgi:hypothetical protein
MTKKGTTVHISTQYSNIPVFQHSSNQPIFRYSIIPLFLFVLFFFACGQQEQSKPKEQSKPEDASPRCPGKIFLIKPRMIRPTLITVKALQISPGSADVAAIGCLCEKRSI